MCSITYREGAATQLPVVITWDDHELNEHAVLGTSIPAIVGVREWDMGMMGPGAPSDSLSKVPHLDSNIKHLFLKWIICHYLWLLGWYSCNIFRDWDFRFLNGNISEFSTSSAGPLGLGLIIVGWGCLWALEDLRTLPLKTPLQYSPYPSLAYKNGWHPAPISLLFSE